MPDPYYERLTQIDNSFLIWEDAPNGCAMHVASTQIHDAAPLRSQDGCLDFDRIEEYVLSRLGRIPRYRQRIARTPLEGHPIWVDDPGFNIRYHVRHSRLPGPGDERQLKRMAGRILSQKLDREKPLWELWIVEGLERDRVAVISKVHHCMVDGVSGSELISALLTPEPCEKASAPDDWRPRPAPGSLQLARDEIARVLRAPAQVGEALIRLTRDDDDARHDLAQRLRGAGQTVREAVAGSTPVPFNRPVGPHRRVDWLTMSLDDLRAVRKALGGSVNDVVLTIAAGALRRFLSDDHGVDLRTLRFRVMAPVSVRPSGERDALGNRVSAWNIELPVAEPDPRARLQRVMRQTAERKESGQALGGELLTGATEWTGSALLSLASRLVTFGTPFNMVITNVPGPPATLYLLGSRMLEIHPHVPLMGTLGLGIALFSYDGTLSWGFSADWELLPDLHELVLDTRRAFDELRRAADID